jgi:hypothetical protein
MAGNVEDTAHTTQEKAVSKKRAGSRCFEAQRRAELETPPENTANISLPKSR